MFKPAIDGRRPAAAVLGWIVGFLMGLLLAAPVFWQASTSADLRPLGEPPDAGALAGTGVGSHALLQALPALCENRSPATDDEFSGLENRNIIVWQQAYSGIKNTRRLLPLAKRLTLEALREAGAANGVSASGLAKGKRRINAVSRIVLDSQLGNAGEVQNARPSEIRIGPAYAMNLTSDDDAIMLLSHELTHVAVWSGKFDGFIESISNKARLAADVVPTDLQKEDLACDFIAALAVKRFVDLNPTTESKAHRLSRVLGYESPDERLLFAWEDFCASYYGDPGDDEHLGLWETVRALRGLDPELKLLVPGDPPLP